MNPTSCATSPNDANDQRREVIETARALRSHDDTNAEYDRALVEMTRTLLGISSEHTDVVAAAIGIAHYERYDY